MSVTTAKRRRKCSRDKTHSVLAGERLLIVRNAGAAGGEKGYCAPCAASMLRAAHEQLAVLEQELTA